RRRKRRDDPDRESHRRGGVLPAPHGGRHPYVTLASKEATMLQFIIGGSVGFVVLAFIIFKMMWRVAEPNEALIISGIRQHTPSDSVQESLGFKIVTGKGTGVVPGVQTVRRLSLDLRESELSIDCVTHQGIPLGIRGVVIF